MKEYQKRVVAEKKALDKKLSALKEFIGTDVYKKLPSGERDRLTRQSWAMGEYSTILGERIVHFE
jgi:hypothetical protein